jgi:hypothetical protein
MISLRKAFTDLPVTTKHSPLKPSEKPVAHGSAPLRLRACEPFRQRLYILIRSVGHKPQFPGYSGLSLYDSHCIDTSVHRRAGGIGESPLSLSCRARQIVT